MVDPLSTPVMMKQFALSFLLITVSFIGALTIGDKRPECGSFCGIDGPAPVRHDPRHHSHHHHHRRRSSRSSSSSDCRPHCKPSYCPSGNYQVSRLQDLLLSYFNTLNFAAVSNLLSPDATVTILAEVCSLGQCCRGTYPATDFFTFLNGFGFKFNVNYPQGHYKRGCKIIEKVSTIFTWPVGTKAYEMSFTWGPVSGTCQYQIEHINVVDFRCKPSNTLDLGQNNPPTCTCQL